MPRRSLSTLGAMAAAAALAAAAPAAAAPVREPTLVGRALLAPDASAPAPFAGAPNTEPAPAPGARQPVGGFSALIEAKGKDTFRAMPDNGFGSQANVGLGDRFAMPYVTIEAVLPLRGQRLAIVNDTNFGSTGRNPELPDPSDFIVVRVAGLRGE